MSDVVAAAVENHGRCLLIDGHSFGSRPYPHENDQSPNRPDICIGTDSFHTPPWLTDLATAIFRKQGLQVEMYMCEESGDKLPTFSEFAAATGVALKELIAQEAYG